MNGTFASLKALIPIFLKLCEGYFKNRDQNLEISQSIKHLPCKHGKLGLLPRTQVKGKVGMEGHFIIAELRKPRQTPSWSASLAYLAVTGS